MLRRAARASCIACMPVFCFFFSEGLGPFWGVGWGVCFCDWGWGVAGRGRSNRHVQTGPSDLSVDSSRVVTGQES